MLSKFAPLLWITGAIVLCVLLFLLPRTPAPKPAPTKAVSGAADIRFWLKRALAQEPATRAQNYERWANAKIWDSLKWFWNTAKRPDLMASIMEQQAAEHNTDSLWLLAGKTYYKAVRFCADSTELPVLFEASKRCLQMVLKHSPANAEAKLLLASCWVDEGRDPMKGISLLRELEASDSTRTDVQLTLGLFSMRSQQFDKAVRRFKTVLRLDPAYIEAYLHLADAYQQQGRIDQARDALKAYADLTPNPAEREEIKNYINQLHN